MDATVDVFVAAVEQLVPCLKDDPQMLAKRAALTKEEKVSACEKIATCATQLIAMRYSDMQKLMEIAVETLFAICNDADSAVRLVADEALNKLIRSCLQHHQTRIHYELFKEIKRNGHSRSVRAALVKFADCVRFVKSPKTRAYLVNLIPALAKLWQRDDDMLHECIATFLERIAPCLLPHGSDADVLSLLKAILPNLHADSVVTRRTAATCLRSVCESAREPLAYLAWTMNVLVDMLLPVDETKDPSTIVGALQSVRALLPAFAHHVAAKPRSEVARSNEASSEPQPETAADLVKLSAFESVSACGEQSKQVLQILLHFVRTSRDSNILVAALESLAAFLAEPALARRLLLERGAVQPSLVLARDIQRENRERRRVARLSITSLKQTAFESPGVSPAHRATGTAAAAGATQPHGTTSAAPGGQLRTARSRSPSSYSTSSASASIGDEVFAATRQQQNDGIEAAVGETETETEETDAEHPPTGDVLKTSATLHSLSEQIHSSRADEKPIRDDDEEQTTPANASSDDADLSTISGKTDKSPSLAVDNTSLIGILMEEASYDAGTLVYIARLLAVRFLLDGEAGKLLVAPATVVRISHRSLALQCVSKLLAYRADLLELSLFREAANVTNSQSQRLSDIVLYIEHDDPLLRAQTCELFGALLRYAVARMVDDRPATLTADRLLSRLLAVLQPSFSCAQSKKAAVAAFSSALSVMLDYAVILTSHESQSRPEKLSESQSAFLERFFAIVHHLFDSVLLDKDLYWLVRLELIELLKQTDFGSLFFCFWNVFQRGDLVDQFKRRDVRVPHWKWLRDVLFNNVLPLMLGDEDARIRNALCDCLLVIVPNVTNLSADFQPDLLAHERALRTRFRLSLCCMQHSVQQYTMGLYPALVKLSSSIGPHTRSQADAPNDAEAEADVDSCQGQPDERQLENVSYFIKWLHVACLHRAEQKFFVQSSLQLIADFSDRYAFVDSLLTDKQCLSLIRFLVDLLGNVNFSLDLRVQNSLVRALGNLLEQAAQRCVDDTVRSVLSGASQSAATDPKASSAGTQPSALLLTYADREWSLLAENKELVRCFYATLRHVHFLVSSYCAVLDGVPARPHVDPQAAPIGKAEKEKDVDTSVRVSQAAEAIAAKLPAIVTNASPFRMRKLLTAVTSVAAGEKPAPLLQSFTLSGSSSQNNTSSPSLPSSAPPGMNTGTNAAPVSFHSIFYQRLSDLIRTVAATERSSADFERADRLWMLLRSAVYSLTQLLEFCTLSDLLRLHLLDELAANYRALARVEPAHVFACLQATFRSIFLVNRVGRAIKTKPASPASPTKHARTPRRLSAVSAQTHLFDEAFSDDSSAADAVSNATDLNGIVNLTSSPHALTRLLVAEVLERSQLDYLSSRDVQQARLQPSLLVVTQRVFRFSPVEPACPKTVHKEAPGLIRKFERLVLDSLSICPMAHHVETQNAILNVLIQLVQLRINYTMLDVDLSLFNYVLKQAEILGDAEATGQFDNSMHQRAALLIPSLFTFLLLLAFDSSTKQIAKTAAQPASGASPATAASGAGATSKTNEQKNVPEVRKDGEQSSTTTQTTSSASAPSAAATTGGAGAPLITSEKVIQLCDTLMAGTLSVESHILPALACIVNELFVARMNLSQYATFSSPPTAAQMETYAMYDTQREYLVAILIRIMNRHPLLSCISTKIFSILTVILCGWRRISESQYAKCSEQLWYMALLPLLERAVAPDTKRTESDVDNASEASSPPQRVCAAKYIRTLFRFVSCLSTANVSSESLMRLLDSALKRLGDNKLRDSSVAIVTVLWHLLVHARRNEEALERDGELLANCLVSNFSVVEAFAARFDDSKLAEYRRERLAAVGGANESQSSAATTVSAVYILTRLLSGYATLLLNDSTHRDWFELLLHVHLALYRLYTLSSVYQPYSKAAAELFANGSVRGVQLLAELGFVFAHLSEQYPSVYLQFVACFSNFTSAPLPTDERLISVRSAPLCSTKGLRQRRIGQKEFRLQVLLEALSHRLFLASNAAISGSASVSETQVRALLGDTLTFVAENRLVKLTLSSGACISYHQCLSYFCDILLTLNTTSKSKALISGAVLARLAHFLIEEVLAEIVVVDQEQEQLLRNVSARKEIYKAALCVLKQVLHNLIESAANDAELDRVAIGERLKSRFLDLMRSRVFWKTSDIVEVEGDILERALAHFDRPKDDADDSVFDSTSQPGTGLRKLDRAEYSALVRKMAARAGDQPDDQPLAAQAIASLLFGLSREELTQVLNDKSLSTAVFYKTFELIRVNLEEVRFAQHFLPMAASLPASLAQLLLIFEVTQTCFLARVRDRDVGLLAAAPRYLEVKLLIERENRHVTDEARASGVRRIFFDLHRALLTEVDSIADLTRFVCCLIESLLASCTTSDADSRGPVRIRPSELYDMLTTIRLLLGDAESFNDDALAKRFVKCVAQFVGVSASLYDEGRVRWPSAFEADGELDSYFVELIERLILHKNEQSHRLSRSRLPRSLARLLRLVLIGLTKNVSHLNILAKLPTGSSIEPSAIGANEQSFGRPDDFEPSDSFLDLHPSGERDRSDSLRIRTASSTSLASTSSVANLYTSLLEQLHDRFPVLEEFQQRLAVFGWRKKFEFEEIWMCLLSVLNPPPKTGEDPAAAMTQSGDDVEDERAQTQSAVWTIRCINQLLLRTRLHRTAHPSLSSRRGRLRIDPFAATPLLRMLVQRVDQLIAAKWLGGLGSHLIDGDLDQNAVLNLSWSASPEYTMSVSGEYYDLTFSSLSDLLEQIGLLPAALSRRDSGSGVEDASQIGELASATVDTRSCVQFLLELFQQWLSLQTASTGQPTIGQPSALVKECVRSLLCLSEFFVEASQFDKMVQILLDVRAFYVAEDELTSHYVLVGLGKALCVLALARATGVDNSLGKEWAAPLEKVHQVLVAPLRRFVTIAANLFGLSCNEAVLSPATLANSPVLFNAECLALLQTLLYVFECWSLMNQTNTSGVTVVAEYVTFNDFFTDSASGSNMFAILELTVQLFERIWLNQLVFQTAIHTLTERHLNTLLSLGFFLVENFPNVLEIKFPTFAPRFLQQALNFVNLNTAQLMNMTATYWSACTLWQSSCVIIVRAFHRLMLRSQLSPQSLYESVVTKLTGDWLRSPANELFSLLCVEFIVSWLYLGVLGEQPQLQPKTPTTVAPAAASLNSQLVVSLANKESMHLLIERMCTLFSRMKRAHSFETVTIARLLEALVLRCYVPSNDFLNKIMSEFLGVLNMEPAFSKSSKQSLQHPRNLETVTRSFAALVYAIFQRALTLASDDQERALVHTWIRLTLTNFLQLSSLAKSFWSISNLLLGATASASASSANVNAIRNGLFAYCATMTLHYRPVRLARSPPLSLTQLFGDALSQYAAQLRNFAPGSPEDGDGYEAFHRALHGALQSRTADRNKSMLSRESTGGSVTADDQASVAFTSSASTWSRSDERALHQFLVQVLKELPPVQQSS